MTFAHVESKIGQQTSFENFLSFLSSNTHFQYWQVLECHTIGKRGDFWICIEIIVWESQKWRFVLHDLCISICGC
jgi:hypothetical protein